MPRRRAPLRLARPAVRARLAARPGRPRLSARHGQAALAVQFAVALNKAEFAELGAHFGEPASQLSVFHRQARDFAARLSDLRFEIAGEVETTATAASTASTTSAIVAALASVAAVKLAAALGRPDTKAGAARGLWSSTSRIARPSGAGAARPPCRDRAF